VLELLEAVFLGIVQGLTEFLPVSSSGHLLLSQYFLSMDQERFGLHFDAAIHTGTVLAVVLFFRRDLLSMARAFFRSLPRPDLSEPLGELARDWALLFTVFLPGVLVPFVLVDLWEETAWPGLMQHTLQEERGSLLASIMVAPFFALIHMPGFFVAGFISDEKTPLSEFPAVLMQVGILAVFAVFIRVLIMWLYNGSGRSVIIVGLFHSAFNMTNGQKITLDLLALPEGLASLIPAVAVMVLAVLLVVFTRSRLSHETGRGAATRPAEVGGVVTSQSRVR
jgi:membrane protease YdiL (CAAX protease family)